MAPVTAGGVPHQLTKDDIHDGYFLRAGTVVHANQWAIHRDPSYILSRRTLTRLAGYQKSFPPTTSPSQSSQACKSSRHLAPGAEFVPE